MAEIVYASLEEVPEDLKDVAKKGEDGKYTVKVVAASKLDEFRERNITTSRERDTLAAALAKVKPFVGEDPDAFAVRMKELEDIAQKVKDGTLKGSDAVAKEVDNRVAAMKEDYARQLREQATKASAAEANATSWEERYKKTRIDRAVTDAVVNPASGALPDALDDILSRAYNVFKVDGDGNIVAKDGEAIRYGSDGTTPMTPLEWLASLRAKAPYLFKGSSGGGANGGANGGRNQYGGMSKADFDKLSPEAKLAQFWKNKGSK